MLGYHLLEEEEKPKLEKILSVCHQFDIDDQLIRKSIALRQQKKISLGDSIIAATALIHQLLLVTANEADFKWIANLQLHNPIH